MNSFLRKLFAFLFPVRCVTCREENFWICPPCVKRLPSAHKPDADWIISVWSYKDRGLKRLLWLLKFKRKFDVARDLGPALYDHLLDELTERGLFENFEAGTLVPIPLGRARLRKRGYNQSAILARELAKRSNGSLHVEENILQKINDGAPQNSIKNRRARFQNIVGAFTAKNAPRITGKNFIIIDDITTTHATLLEARKVLKKAGAKKVLAFTVAH